MAGAGVRAGGAPTGGGVNIAAGRATLNNTIVAGNNHTLSGRSTADDVSGSAYPTSAYNLIGVGSGASGLSAANHNQVGSVGSPIDAKLGPLADNGGPTQTMALLPGSPAIDAGSNALAVAANGSPLGADQRGYYRIFNGTVDIGALESGSVALLPGDANADGKVDITDLTILARHYGAGTAGWSDGDFDSDGKVDFMDLVILARNYGRKVSLATAAIN